MRSSAGNRSNYSNPSYGGSSYSNTSYRYTPIRAPTASSGSSTRVGRERTLLLTVGIFFAFVSPALLLAAGAMRSTHAVVVDDEGGSVEHIAAMEPDVPEAGESADSNSILKLLEEDDSDEKKSGEENEPPANSEEKAPDGGEEMLIDGEKLDTIEPPAQQADSSETELTPLVEVLGENDIKDIKYFRATKLHPPFTMAADEPADVISRMDVEAPHLLLMAHLLRSAKQEISSSSESSPILVLDAGASHGGYTLYAAALGCDVISIEAQLHLAQNVLLSARANGFQDRITVFHTAVMQKGDVRLSVVPVKYGMSSLVSFTPQETVETEDNNSAESEKENSLVSSRIDQIVSIQSAAVLLLRIDTGGYETQALRSASALFDKQAVKHIFVRLGSVRRWAATSGTTTSEAYSVLTWLMKDHNFSLRVLRSGCWGGLQRSFYVKPHPVGGNLIGAIDIEFESLPKFIRIFEKSEKGCFLWLSRRKHLW